MTIRTTSKRVTLISPKKTLGSGTIRSWSTNHACGISFGPNGIQSFRPYTTSIWNRLSGIHLKKKTAPKSEVWRQHYPPISFTTICQRRLWLVVKKNYFSAQRLIEGYISHYSSIFHWTCQNCRQPPRNPRTKTTQFRCEFTILRSTWLSWRTNRACFSSATIICTNRPWCNQTATSLWANAMIHQPFTLPTRWPYCITDVSFIVLFRAFHGRRRAPWSPLSRCMVIITFWCSSRICSPICWTSDWPMSRAVTLSALHSIDSPWRIWCRAWSGAAYLTMWPRWTWSR